MSNRKVFKFRRLKWGDPEKKLKLLSEDLVLPGTGKPNREHPILKAFDIILIAFTVASLAVALYLLVT